MEGLYWDRQQELEDIAGFWGEGRYKKRAKRAQEEADATRIGAARKLLMEAVGRVVYGLELWMDDQTTGRGRRHTAVKWIKELGPEATAFIACKVILGGVYQKYPVRSQATRIAELMLDEAKAQLLREKAPGLFEYRMRNFQTNSRVHMARSISSTLNRALCQECRAAERDSCPHLDTARFDIPMRHRFLIGSLLIKIFMEAFPGWLERELVSEGYQHKELYLVPTPKAKAWTDARDELLAEARPVAMPMVVPPLPWGNPERPGGYRFGLYGKYPFVRGSRRHQRMVEESDVRQVYEAANRIQETPWRINQRVWSAMQAIEQGGGDLAGLPPFEPVPLPQRPPELDEEEFDPEILGAYKKAKTAAHDAEAMRNQDVLKWLNLKMVVELVEDEDAFWFPHNLDFRGRIYPIPPFLNPQGDDRCRGLLEFADGEPLGEDGAWWLSIHGANCLGVTPGGHKLSHMTLGERSDWIQLASERIRDTAREPFSDLWWVDADEPWKFLAFCFAWEEMLREDDPTEYVCYLPVSLDGTCNGLQHFAGLLRDSNTAAAVNVLPSKRPSDVYALVAQDALDLLETLAPDEELARLWLGSGLVDRKLCKRPTMTFPYGSKPFGFAQQIIEYLRGLGTWAEHQRDTFTLIGEEGPYLVTKQAAAYLADILWQSLNKRVTGAFEAMAWFQECAREISKSGRCVEWTVPETNFPVIQDRRTYFNLKKKRVDTVLAGGVSYRPVYHEKIESEPNGNRQANAVSPNVVHSLDAAALMKAVTMSSHDGIEHFAMVHDSYGTHPSNMGVLLEATKQAFFHLYSRHDVVQDLYQEWLNQVDDLAVLDSPPSLGGLDIAEVMASDYFFA